MISRRGQFESLLSGLMTRSSVQQRKRRATASRRMQPVEAVEQRLMLDASYFALAGGDFSQDWSNSELITTNDDWSSVPSIVGFRGDGLTTSTGVDPQTVVGESTIVDVNANQTTGTFSTGGVSEFALTNPVVGLAGSGTADAPYLQLHLDASGRQDIQVSYLLRDIDSSGDNAIQPVALQYRIGNTGDFINVPGGFVADASSGPNLATLETPVAVTLPATVNNQSELQIRIITTNAPGNDEYIGIDDIVVSSVAAGGDTTPPTVTSIDDGDADDAVFVGTTLNYTVTFDEDINELTVSPADFVNAGTAGISVGSVTETSPGIFAVSVTATAPGTLVLQIPARAVIEDTAGNALVVPVSDDTTVSVTTDTTAPLLNSVSPADESVAVPVDTVLELTFDEDVQKGSGNFTVHLVSDGSVVQTVSVADAAVTVSGATVTVDLPADLSALTDYYINVAAGAIQDLGGNNFAGISDATLWNFSTAAASSLLTGDIAFVGFNADANDDFAFVALKDIPASEPIMFIDTEWDGSVFVSGEGDLQWIAPASGVPAGTVVVLNNVSTTPTSNVGTVASGTIAIGSSGEGIFAVTGTRAAPGTFLSAISNNGTNGFTTLAGTGLTAGLNAIDFGGTSSQDHDVFVFTGARNDQTSFASYAAIINDPANWISQDGSGDQSADGIAPDLPFDATAFTLGSDTAAPTVVSIEDGDADDSVLTNETLNYVVTFSEDINEATVSSADFSNSGTASISIGVISETSPGIFQVPVTPTSTGTLILQIPTGAVIEDSAGNALVVPVNDDTTIAVSSSDLTAPTVSSIEDNDADNLVAVGQDVTYTITFSEDIDESTVDGSDFVNSGTAGITVGSITETAPGVFTVVVTPTTGGTLVLQIPTGAILNDLSGNALSVPVTDDDILTVDATSPSLVSIDDSVGGGPSPVFVPITFTVTFDEDIDGATVTAADFSNSGSAAVSVSSINETSPGVFAVIVTPSTPGTLQLQIPTGSVISDIVGNDLTVPVQDETVIPITAATTLTAGDIAFTGIQTDAPDTFSFVLLRDVVSGTTITFTDNGWGSDAFANTTENTATVIFGAAYSAGQHFVVSDNSGTATFQIVGTGASAGTILGNLSGISSSGDSVLAYQGPVPESNNASNWIAGISTRSFTSSPSGTNQTDLPSALQLGVNAIQLSETSAEVDNGAYQRPLFIGTVEQIRADVNNVANWVTSNSIGPASNAQFTVGIVSSDLFINEVVFDPTAGSDTGEEYIELRGTPDTYVPADTFLVLLEGDSEDGPGNIDHIFSLGGMVFGSNGYLVLRQSGSTYLADPDATVVTATGSGWGTTFSSRSTDIENGSVSVLLIQSLAAPAADVDVDTNDDGTLDGVTWTVRDAIGNIDGGAADTAYGFFNTSGNGNGAVPAGSTFLNLSGYHPDYMARSGDSAGWQPADWVVGELAGSMPDIALAVGFTLPLNLGGAAVDHLGASNVFAAPVLSIANASVVEGDASTTTVKFVVTLSNASNQTVTVDFSTSDGTATSGSDYVAKNGTLTFAPGEVSKEIDVVVNSDTLAEPDEMFFVTLSSASAAQIGTAVGAGTIQNDDINTAVFDSVVMYNADAVAEKNFSPDQTGQRSIIRQIQVVFDGEVTIPSGAVSDASFVLTNRTTGADVGLTVVSNTIAAGKTTVVLGFTSGIQSSGSLFDGNYRLVIDYVALDIDGDGNGVVGGTRTIDFHCLFGDSDGDRDVDNRDALNYRYAVRGFAAFKSLFDYDNDGSLLSGPSYDRDDYDAFFANYGSRLNPLD